MTEKIGIKQLKSVVGQVTALPTATAELVGKAYQYIGTTSGSYQHGYIYECVETSPNVYGWQRLDVQPGGSRGRFLALWNCTTGLAESDPPISPYEYKTGDYFIVSVVGATNYKPDGLSYVTGTASTTVETNEVAVDDTYFFDGTTWKLQSNSNKTVSFSAIAGDIYDNTSAANALNAKVGSLSDLGITATATELNYTSGVTKNIQAQINNKENILTAGSNISLSTILTVGKNKLDANADGLKVTATPSSNLALNFTKWYLGAAFNGYMNQSSISGFTYGVGTITFKSSDASYGCVKFVRLKPSTVYTISCANPTANHKAAIMCYNDNGNDTYKATTQIQTPTALPYSFTTNADPTQVYGISLYSPLNTEITYTQIQLEEGNQVTTYADYDVLYSTEVSATDTTYTGSDGILLTGTNFTNTGVRSVTTGSTNGTISVNTGGSAADVAVYGLGTAAYTSASDYATAAQGAKADTAVQPADLSSYVTKDTTQTITGEKTFSGSMNYSAGKTYILAGNGGTKLGYWSYDVDGGSNITLQTMTASTRNINFKTNNGGKVTYNGSEIAKVSDLPSVMTGATAGDAGTNGLVPAPAAGDQGKFLQGDGTWATLTIPTVNDSIITITQGGVTKGSFTLNQSSGDTIDLDAGGGDNLPDQTGHAGEFLTTDGTDASWGSPIVATFRTWGVNE